MYGGNSYKIQGDGMIFLSHILDQNTPSYGNREKFQLKKKSDMDCGDVANDTHISTTVHIGTHIDMPYHSYARGQTVEDFDADYWFFNNVKVIDVTPESYIVKDELISKIEKINNTDIEFLIVKTGIEKKRHTEDFWARNYGFHPDIYDKLCEKLPKLRVMGFDSISVSSFTDRMLGREAHRKFLNPKKPILLLEDMKLSEVSENTKFKHLTIAPMRIAGTDGLPCTVLAKLV